MNNNDDEYILLEDRDIYDGWICKIHKLTKELIWRDHWIVNKLSKEEKNKLEHQYLKDIYIHVDKSQK